MDIRKQFITAERGLAAVVAQIKPEQWDIALPAGLTSKPANLRETINYHIYDDAFVPDTLSGKTIAEVGDAYAGDLMGADYMASWNGYMEKAVAAVAALSEADLETLVHLSYGDFKTREYLEHITLYRSFRIHDLAKLIGVDSTMPAGLVQGLYDYMAVKGGSLRQLGVFGPIIDVPADAPLQDRLLGLAGRDPH